MNDPQTPICTSMATTSPKQHEVVLDQPQCGLITDVRRYFGRRRLNRDLAKWFTAATNFKANGLPAGSPAYRQLYDQSCQSIQRHATVWGVDPEKITVEIPALYSLQQLAHPAPKSTPNLAVLIVALTAAFFSAAALLGASSGIFHLIEQTISR